MGLTLFNILPLLGIIFKVAAGQDTNVARMLALVNCSDSMSIQMANEQCLDMYNVAMVIENPEALVGANPVQTLGTINNYLVTASDVICSDQEDFTKAAICLLWVKKICYSGPVVLDIPIEADYLEHLNEICETVAYLRRNANHGTDIDTESGCKLGTDSATLLGLLQQCMERNGINLQLPDIVATSLDFHSLAFAMRDILRSNTEALCSDVGPLTKATECINFLMYRCGSGALYVALLAPEQNLTSGYTETCDVIERLTSVPAEVRSLTENLDCTVQNDVISAQQQCFTLYDVNVEISSPKVLAAGTDLSFFEITSLLVQNAATLCGSLFLNASQCLYHTLYICDTDKRIDMLRFITSNVALQYDQICTLFTHESVDCMIQIDGEIRKCFKGAETCRDEQRQRACEYPIVKTCGIEAVSLFESQIDSDCRNDPDSVVTLPDGRLHRMDCSTSKGIQDGYIDCFTYQGIDLPGPESHSHSLEFIFESITEEFVNDLCSNLTLYQEAVSCVLNVANKCVATPEHALLPDSAKVNEGIVTLCQKRDEFDDECVKNADKSPCLNLHDDGQRHRNCSSVLTQHRCRLDSIESCDKDTRDIYSEVLDWQLPISCLTGSHVTTPSTEGGGAYCLSVSISLLVLSFGIFLF